MKSMITGGNQGLGLTIAQSLGCDSYSRSNGYDIVDHRSKLAELSLDYDVFINNAYEGFMRPGIHTAQTSLLYDVAMLWQETNKDGHIINIGSVGSEDSSAPFPEWEGYNASKRALKHMSLQWTQAFRTNQVRFRTSLLTLDRLDTARGRAMPTWTGNALDLEGVVDMIRLCIGARPNTCVGEIQAWVNIDHKQI